MITALYINWNPDLMALHLGAFGIRWYSLCWLIGLLGGYFCMRHLYREQKIGDEKFEPLFIYCFLGILLGARLGHCIFYEPGYFLASLRGFIEMFLPIRISDIGQPIDNIIHGNWRFTGYEGLASHGGTFGLMISLLIYCRSMKLKPFTVLDNIAIITGLTACFIRLGNLMNSEIIGKPTDLPWAFIFERVDMMPRHPGQLYEAIFYGLLFLVMWNIRRYASRPSSPTLPAIGSGWYFGLCLNSIFIFRILIEYTKENQEAFEQGMLLNMGQLLSVPFIIIGTVCMLKAKK